MNLMFLVGEGVSKLIAELHFLGRIVPWIEANLTVMEAGVQPLVHIGVVRWPAR